MDVSGQSMGPRVCWKVRNILHKVNKFLEKFALSDHWLLILLSCFAGNHLSHFCVLLGALLYISGSMDLVKVFP